VFANFLHLILKTSEHQTVDDKIIALCELNWTELNKHMGQKHPARTSMPALYSIVSIKKILQLLEISVLVTTQVPKRSLKNHFFGIRLILDR
jgi:hypothetical protein